MAPLKHHNPLPKVVVTGDFSSCGTMTAQACSERIEKSLATYKKIFALCDISWQNAIQQAQLHLPVIKEFAPHLLDELEGIAAANTAIGINSESLLALNCRTEILPPDFLLRAMATDGSVTGDSKNKSSYLNECTSLAIARPQSQVWLAQNWDWIGLQREALIVLHAQPHNSPAYITVTEAGMLAKIGFNDKGLGVSLNILRSHDDGQSPGMPVHFLLRALLECSNVDEACDFAVRLPYASSSNILIADESGNMASLEISPRGCRVLSPDNKQNQQLCHTNHFLNAELAQKDAGLAGNISTIKRLSAAQRQLPEIEDFSDIKTLLSDDTEGSESICRFADTALSEIAQIETVVGVAMNLSERTLMVSAAQPSISEFSEHQL